MKPRSYIAVALFAAPLLIGRGNAEPLRFEAQVGICQPAIASKGSWWNTDYPTNIDADSGCFSLGVSQITSEWRGYKLGWRAAYLNFGEVRANNVFALHDDQQFLGLTGADCNRHTLRGCIGRGIISQKTQGLMVGGLIERDMGGFTLGADAGGYFYYSRFTATVVPHGPSAWGPPGTFDWAGTNVTPYVGLTANYGLLFIALRSFWTIRASESCAGCTGITSGVAYQAMAGIQIPIN